MSEIAPYRPAAVVLAPASEMDAAVSDEGARQVALLVYGCYLASFFVPPLIIGGLVLAYINRETAPEWLKSHFAFQVRTFWLYLAYLAVSILLCAVLIGLVLIVVTLGWFVTPQVLGLGRLMKREAHPRPLSWI